MCFQQFGLHSYDTLDGGSMKHGLEEKDDGPCIGRSLGAFGHYGWLILH